MSASHGDGGDFAVCQQRAGVKSHDILIEPGRSYPCHVTISTHYLDGSYRKRCPAGICDCSKLNPIYGVQCGSLVGNVGINLALAANPFGPPLHTYLTNLGIGNVNTIYGIVSLTFGQQFELFWPVDVFPNLEVIREYPGDALQPDQT